MNDYFKLNNKWITKIYFRLREVGHYEKLDENKVKCKTSQDINEELINKIINIYNTKIIKH